MIFWHDFPLKRGSKLDRRAIWMKFSTLYAGQNFVAEQYEWDFVMILHCKSAQNLIAEHNLNEILTWFSTQRWLKTWLLSTIKEILTRFSTLGRLKLGCRALWKGFWQHFPLYGGSKLGCRALWQRFWHDFPFYGGLNLDCKELWKRFWHDFPLTEGSKRG